MKYPNGHVTLGWTDGCTVGSKVGLGKVGLKVGFGIVGFADGSTVGCCDGRTDMVGRAVGTLIDSMIILPDVSDPPQAVES